MKQWLTALLVGFLLVGFADPTIDGSDRESADASIEHIRQSLASEKQAQFDAAYRLILRTEMKEALRTMGDEEPTGHRPSDSVLDVIDGMTASDVISYADSLRQEQPERR